MAAVAGAHLVLALFDAAQGADGLQILHHDLAGLSGGHACVLAAVQDLGLVGGELAALLQSQVGVPVSLAGHLAVIGEAADQGQVVTETDLEVIGVVGGGDLDDTGALFHVGVLVADDGDFLVQQGQDDGAAVELLVALVIRVDGHGHVAQHGLGTGGGDLQALIGTLDGVQQIPEVAVLLLMLDFGVGDGGLALGAPVDQTVAAVDLAFVVQLHEDFQHGLGALLVHGEVVAGPVAGAAQGPQL